MAGSENDAKVGRFTGETDEIAAGNIETKGGIFIIIIKIVFDQSDLRFLREEAEKEKEKKRIEDEKMNKELRKFKISFLLIN